MMLSPHSIQPITFDGRRDAITVPTAPVTSEKATA
jgi:hypothetical protein